LDSREQEIADLAAEIANLDQNRSNLRQELEKAETDLVRAKRLVQTEEVSLKYINYDNWIGYKLFSLISAQENVKSAKSQIKEAKNEKAGLDTALEEYNNAYIHIQFNLCTYFVSNIIFCKNSRKDDDVESKIQKKRSEMHETSLSIRAKSEAYDEVCQKIDSLTRKTTEDKQKLMQIE